MRDLTSTGTGQILLQFHVRDYCIILGPVSQIKLSMFDIDICFIYTGVLLLMVCKQILRHTV